VSYIQHLFIFYRTQHASEILYSSCEWSIRECSGTLAKLHTSVAGDCSLRYLSTHKSALDLPWRSVRIDQPLESVALQWVESVSLPVVLVGRAFLRHAAVFGDSPETQQIGAHRWFPRGPMMMRTPSLLPRSTQIPVGTALRSNMRRLLSVSLLRLVRMRHRESYSTHD